MKFRTDINIPSSPINIDYQSHILALGSCFADRIGTRLNQAKIPTLTNPLGIIYNPLSLCKLFQWIQNPHQTLELEQASSGLWHSFDLHTQMSNLNRAKLEKEIHDTLHQTTSHLSKSRILILTFGTAYVYERKQNQQIVANCHKYPSNLFEKRLLAHSEIVNAYQQLIPQLFTQTPDLQIILSVSPIRHIKEGLPNNMLSKSILRIACEELSNTFEQVQYFPSYEIMLDDLRDYRYYEDDLIHPNNFAQQYIWEKFVDTYFTPEAKLLLKKWSKLQKAVNHRSLHEKTETHKAFLQTLLSKLDAISTNIDCKIEREEISKRLANLSSQ